MAYGLQYRVEVRVQGSGFRVQGSGQGSGFRVQGSGFRVQGSGLRSGFRVQGSGFRVQSQNAGKLNCIIPQQDMNKIAAQPPGRI
jgi:hypothetical protein